MKVTLGEVLNNYTVIRDGTYVLSYMFSDDEDSATVNIYDGDGEPGGLDRNFDENQYVEADGSNFTVTDTKGVKWQFQAFKVVKLAEVPELR